MNTRNKPLASEFGTKRLWIGMVEVRSLGAKSEILGDTKGAFVNIVTWASAADEFRRNADLVIADLNGLFVSEVVDAEPVEMRRSRMGGAFDEMVEDMISRAETNPKAIIYGTFHTFENDDA
jgi:hypothetical protein